ncbi:MAG TPA: hypothetical protein VL328_12900 [Gemmatimonadaceae bacterium]|nr:hypothetical protein [Gemmatimonadaceae bacterium]
MHRLARHALLALVLALLSLGSAPLGAQRRVQLTVTVPTATAPGLVVATGLFADPEMRELVRSGFPASLRFRLELWRSGGLFNDLVGTHEWELIVQYDPSGQRYRVVRRLGGRLEDLGSFATLATAQAMLERPLRITLLPDRAGRRYYYNFVLDISALSVSDMDQLERWLRGVRGGTAAGALGSGVRTLMLRMLGGENRHYDRRSAQFEVQGQ